jgi:hypothetical protein
VAPLDILLPLQQSAEDTRRSSPVEEALAKKLGREGLLRVKAMEFTLQVLAGRASSTTIIDNTYDIIYNKIKNGATKARPKVY